MADDATDRRVGPWRLLEGLGKGGNATVWRAVKADEDSPELAVKVLNSTKVGGEPYRRFRAEVGVLRRLTDPGVLPLLDSHLPDRLSGDDPAWLAMPIATPLDEALAESPLEQVIEACATIADTLARLRGDHQLGHRDIKPGNLYEHDGHWLVGDFGLVADPSSDAITEGNRPLGPRHFCASEMVLRPAQADPGPADVYSLAKTLWVLAAGQRFPPDGHQAADVHTWSLATLRAHPNAALLDRLIDRATHLRPENRPTMEQLAGELRAWLDLELSEADVELSESVARVREAIAEQMDAEELRDMAKEVWLEASRVVQAQLRPLEDVLRQAHRKLDVVSDDKVLNFQLRTHEHMQSPQVEHRWQRIQVLRAGRDFLGYGLRTGVSVELLDTGELVFRAAAEVSFERMTGMMFNWQSPDIAVEATPIAAEKAARDVVGQLAAQLRPAMDAFAENIPAG